MTYADVLAEMNRVRPRRDDNTLYVPPQQRITHYLSALYKHHDRTGPSNQTGRGRGRGRGRVTSSYDVTENLNQLSLTDVIDFEAYEDIPVEVSGDNVPKEVKSFEEIDMCEALKVNVKRCKYVKPTPIQRYAIPIVVAGRDLMACAQTGSGKTAAFCFPIIAGILKGQGNARSGFGVASPSALILSPTRELTCQIHEEAKKFAFQTGIKIAVVYGGAPIYNQLRQIERGVDILVATPGRLVDMIDRGKISLSGIKYLALDEADRMLDMGFEHQIRDIVEQKGMPQTGVRQTMLFSATFPEQIQRLASDFLSNYIFLTVGRVGSSTELIEQKVVFVEGWNKRNHLIDILHSQTGRPLTLVFVETKRGADSLENYLSANGLPATAIHGDKIQMERERALKAFKRGQTPILVATDVASRGLDIPLVAHVINYDLPKGIDDYVHRIGRTGRAGRSGQATAFFTEDNLPLAKDLVKLMEDANQDVPSWLCDYAKDSSHAGYGARPHEKSKFGGYDFRSSYSSGNYGDAIASAGSSGATYGFLTTVDKDSSLADSSSATVDFPMTADKDSSVAGASYSAEASTSTSAADFGFSYEHIVASGWD